MPFEKGNKINLGREHKPFATALRAEIAKCDDFRQLRKIASNLLKRAEGDTHAAKEVADRLDGKVPQAIVGDEDHPPLQTETQIIERIIIGAIADTDSEGISAPIKPN